MRLIYVNMQHNYVDSQHNEVNMRDNHVNMRLTLCCMSICILHVGDISMLP